MKKLLSFLFIFVAAFTLIACGEDNGGDNGGNEQKEKVTLKMLLERGAFLIEN